MRKQKGSPCREAGLPATPSQASPLANLPDNASRGKAGQREVARASLLRGGRGQTLLEILLAFGVAILVLSAVVSGVITSLSNTQYTKNQNLADFYAKEGMAVIRQIRDSGWPTFSSYTTNTTYCISQNSTILTNPVAPAVDCGQNVGIFSREVKFDHESSGCSAGTPPTPTPTPTLIPKGSKVTVIVSWSDNKCPVGNPFCHKVELISCFSNLDQKQAP